MKKKESCDEKVTTGLTVNPEPSTQPMHSLTARRAWLELLGYVKRCCRSYSYRLTELT